MPVTTWFSPYMVAFGVLICGALVVRSQALDESLLIFHPTRQYRSAMIARACYFDRSPKVAEWARRVAAANRSMQPAGEPPLMEWAACGAYELLDKEHLAVPRALAALVWVLGALPLFGLARRVASPDAALGGVALYLFLPYGIIASRAFQPDALMTLGCLVTLIALVRHHERPDTPRMLLAAAAIATTALVKPMSVFMTVAAVVSLALVRVGWRRVVIARELWTLLPLGLLPPALHYGYGALFGTLVRDQMQLRFVPSLLASEFFWDGWWTQIGRVFGAPAFVAALMGSVVATRGAPRGLLVGLWVGYAAFAIAFTYHMPTHDYYHLPYIAVAALGVTAFIGFLERSPLLRARPQSGAWTTRVLTLVIVIGGSMAAWPRLHVDDAATRLARYEEIGALTEHRTNVLFLDHEYGYPLMYHGQLSGDAWPSSDDLRAESLGGLPPLDAHARFARDYADFAPSYFVVTDLESLAAQPDLQRLLDERVTPVRQTSTYHVYKFLD